MIDHLYCYFASPGLLRMSPTVLAGVKTKATMKKPGNADICLQDINVLPYLPPALDGILYFKTCAVLDDLY